MDSMTREEQIRAAALQAAAHTTLTVDHAHTARDRAAAMTDQVLGVAERYEAYIRGGRDCCA